MKNVTPSRARVKAIKAATNGTSAEPKPVKPVESIPYDKAVLLETPDSEIGLAPADTAHDEAQAAANEMRVVVTVRNPVTGKLLGTYAPQSTDEIGELPEFLDRRNQTESEMQTQTHTNGKVKTNFKASSKTASKKATAKPKPVAKKAAKTSEPKGPTGMTAELIKLAQRKQGASADELNKKCNWKGAPWKWLFQNRKKNGWADRFGYKFEVKSVEGTKRYFLK